MWNKTLNGFTFNHLSGNLWSLSNAEFWRSERYPWQDIDVIIAIGKKVFREEREKTYREFCERNEINHVGPLEDEQKIKMREEQQNSLFYFEESKIISLIQSPQKSYLKFTLSNLKATE